MTEAVAADLMLRSVSVGMPLPRHRSAWPRLAPSPAQSPATGFPRLPVRKPFLGSPEWFFDAVGRIEPGKALDKGQRTALAMALPPTLCLAAAYGGTVQGADLALPISTSTRFDAPVSIGTLEMVPEATPAIRERLEQADDLFGLQFMGGIGETSQAVYRDRAKHRAAPGPGPVVFFGATLIETTDPNRFVRAVRTSILPPGYRTVPVSAGAGAEGVCLVAPGGPRGHAQWCAWATETGVGEVSVVRRGWNVDELGALMRDVRASTEVTVEKRWTPADLR